MTSWKNSIFLILGIGVSHLGNWIYFIALNILILNLTGSAAAVAGLYIIRPVAILITNTWSGSVIDRVNKRKLMIFIDIIRGTLVICIPFIGSLWAIYIVLLLVNIAGAFFGPSSSVYITKLVPQENRKRFNSIMSMTSPGAFLLGPAIAGILIMYVSPDICIIINAVSFFVCAFFIYLLPNVDEDLNNIRERVHWKTILNDWKAVKQFIKQTKYFISVYILFQSAMLIAFAVDSQEVTFIKQHLKLSDRDYGLIVSITGIGSLTGAAVAAITSKKIHLRLFIGVGMLLTSLGYVMFYASFNFITATLAFVFLGFFLAFANTGYATFFQNNVPVKIMGRFGSIADMVQGMIQIGLTLLLGLMAEWFSVQLVCLIFTIIGTLIASILLLTVLIPSKLRYFEENTTAISG
ncbi:MFS transporter [Bacillus aquiflavi]|uniref:MFS transporter n=1 Tax=Bacillus aquiflavi TaxID=2672567 RepID=UPI001CA9D5ED|nr:MFS transporter [Bacillus aquiflavi]UAC48252.1 MFS transporter [Bacillus aquiflavi]